MVKFVYDLTNSIFQKSSILKHMRLGQIACRRMQVLWCRLKRFINQQQKTLNHKPLTMQALNTFFGLNSKEAAVTLKIFIKIKHSPHVFLSNLYSRINLKFATLFIYLKMSLECSLVSVAFQPATLHCQNVFILKQLVHT